MRIKFLGGCREVGRNAVLLETDRRILLDCGVKVETGEIPLPSGKVDAVILTHPHLDHSGMVPSVRSRVFSTAATLEQADLLLRDSIKVQRSKHLPVYFSERDVSRMEKVRVTFGQEFEIGDTLIDIYNSGHVPGSFGVLIDKKLFYTSDFRLSDTRLLRGADFDVKNVETMVVESTYAFKEHPPREEVEKMLVEIVEETLSKNGVVLIPCFAIGRSMEILMVLDHYDVPCPVYLDGMAKKALDITLSYPEFLKDPEALRKAAERAVPIFDHRDRKIALKRPSVVVTTSGMLSGGPIISYLKKLKNRPECSLVFTGFQVPGTPGRTLLDTGYYRNGTEFKVEMRVEYLDFSAHADRSELLEFLRKTSPERLIVIHGDECERFAEEVKNDLGIPASAPENGDTLEV